MQSVVIYLMLFDSRRLTCWFLMCSLTMKNQGVHCTGKHLVMQALSAHTLTARATVCNVLHTVKNLSYSNNAYLLPHAITS